MQKLILQPRDHSYQPDPVALEKIGQQILKSFDNSDIVVVPAGFDLFLLDDEGITLLTPQVQLPE